MNLEELKQFLTENGYEDTVVFECPDYASACIGVSSDGRAIYSYDKMIEHLMMTDNMDMEEQWNLSGTIPKGRCLMPEKRPRLSVTILWKCKV